MAPFLVHDLGHHSGWGESIHLLALAECFHFAEENIRVLVDEEADCQRGSSQVLAVDMNDVIDGARQHDPRLRPTRANIVRQSGRKTPASVLTAQCAAQSIQKREMHELNKDAISGDHLFLFCECQFYTSLHQYLLYLIVAGHVGQIDCEDNTEEDGQHEGRASPRAPCAVVICKRSFSACGRSRQELQVAQGQCEIYPFPVAS